MRPPRIESRLPVRPDPSPGQLEMRSRRPGLASFLRHARAIARGARGITWLTFPLACASAVLVQMRFDQAPASALAIIDQVCAKMDVYARRPNPPGTVDGSVEPLKAGPMPLNIRTAGRKNSTPPANIKA